MPLLDLKPADFRADNLVMLRFNVFATMLWPADAARRRAVIMSATQDALEQRAVSQNASLTISAEFLRQRGPRVDPARAIEEATELAVEGSAGVEGAFNLTGGVVAGEILLQAFALYDDGKRDIALSECLRLVSAALTAKQRSKRARPEDLRKHWHHFRGVANFWAADLQMDRQGLCTEDLPTFGRFLLLAELNRNRGLRIRHRNASEAILDPTLCWELPSAIGTSIVALDPTLHADPAQFFCS